MSGDVAGVAAALLAARRGGPVVAPSSALADLATAYAIQDAVLAQLGGIAGWKGGPADAAAVRTSAIAAGTVRRSPARFDPTGMRIIGVEGEIAFLMARGFAAGATPGADEVLAAVASAHVAIEVCDTRIEPWRDADPLWKLADCQINAGLVLGEAIADWRGRDLATQDATLAADGTVLGRSQGLLPSGDPRQVLVHVVQHLCGLRGGISAGAAVTTGSWTGLPLVAAGSEVVVEFADLGEARVRF